jgi:parallel beta-helix repeat protein
MMMRLPAGVLWLLSAAWVSAAGPTLFVAPAGKEGWSGRSPEPNPAGTDGPLPSLVAARDAVRAQRASGQAAGPATVHVRSGTYYIEAPLALGPEDSDLAFVAYQDEHPEIVGGRPITGFTRGADGVLSVALPEVKAGRWDFRSLFIDGRRMVRARQPNVDPNDPCRKGFLHTAHDATAFGTCVGCIHNPGDWMEYDIVVPAAGEYRLLVYYGAFNQPFGTDTMAGQTVMQVDGGVAVPLLDLGDTGSWALARWAESARLTLNAGPHRLHWENVKGGGLNLAAFALCDDPAWKPEGDTLPPLPAGRHAVVIQASSFVKSQGRQLLVSGTEKGDPTRFRYAPGEFQVAWAQAPGAEVHIFPTGLCRAFKEIVAIAGIDEATRRVTVAGPEAIAEVYAGDRYFVENVRDLLDAPGEWYLDRSAGVLYLIPPEGFAAGSLVVAPVAERLVEVRGTPERPVAGLSFRGLSFRGGDYRPSDGCNGFGMGRHGVLWFSSASHCTVERCRFTNGGKDAVLLEGGSGNTIADCDISDSAEGGINLLNSAGNRITGNHIHHCGKVYKHNGGVTLQGAGSADNLVSRNVIHDMPRYGITMKVAGGKNVIEYNRILNTSLETYDTGAIEVTQEDREVRSGTVIRGNIVGDTVGYNAPDGRPEFLGWGIYLDSFAGGYTVTENIVYRTWNGGIMFQGGIDNTVCNNIFVDGRHWQGCISNFDNQQRGCVLERNVFCFSNPAAALFGAPVLQPEVIRADYNLYYCAGAKEYKVGWGAEPFAEWQKAGFDVHSVLADPQFVNAAADDYTLKPGSPAFALGFRPLDTSKVAPPCACSITPAAPIYFPPLAATP